MTFPDIRLAPMEAKLVGALPEGRGWRFEPKWDGFRCLAFRRGSKADLQSKSGKPLARYFPEVVEALLALDEDVAIDGELLIPRRGALSFDALQARLHPAESRIRKLSRETPALFMLFDCLWAAGRNLLEAPLEERRAALEAFHARNAAGLLRLSPTTDRRATAERWLTGAGRALDGVVAKRTDEPYRAGERAMLKVKRMRTADCVVGGFRYAHGSPLVGSLLLGLYDEAGLLHHVGFTSAFAGIDRAALTRRLEALAGAPGFTGDAPGGPSRWQTERSAEWRPLRPELVAEVRYDHVTAGRFRHGTALLRWRPDKDPAQCTCDQIATGPQPPIVRQALGD